MINYRITSREVADVIIRIKIGMAPGPDVLTGRFYKWLEEVISLQGEHQQLPTLLWILCIPASLSAPAQYRTGLPFSSPFITTHAVTWH